MLKNSMQLQCSDNNKTQTRFETDSEIAYCYSSIAVDKKGVLTSLATDFYGHYTTGLGRIEDSVRGVRACVCVCVCVCV